MIIPDWELHDHQNRITQSIDTFGFCEFCGFECDYIDKLNYDLGKDEVACICEHKQFLSSFLDWSKEVEHYHLAKQLRELYGNVFNVEYQKEIYKAYKNSRLHRCMFDSENEYQEKHLKLIYLAIIKDLNQKVEQNEKRK